MKKTSKALPKAQVGKIVKKAVKAVTKEHDIPRSVGRTSNPSTGLNYHPHKEFHGASGRKTAAQDLKEKRIGNAIGLGAGAGAAAVGAAMTKRKGGAVKTKKKK